MRIVPHVDIFFDVFVGEGELYTFLFCHLDLVPQMKVMFK